MEGHTSTIENGPKSKEIVVGVSGGMNEGLFVAAHIQSQPIPLLVDTGATSSILSEKFIKTLSPPLQIKPVSINLVTATGDKKPFVGESEVTVKLGGHIFTHKVLIADISNEGILGMDFLSKNNCDVLLSKKFYVIKVRIFLVFIIKKRLSTLALELPC